MTISQGATDVRSRTRQGRPGQWAEMSNNDEYFTGLNQAPQAKQISTITVSGPTNNENYTVTINGFDISYQADGTATTTEVVNGLVAAINADQRVRGQVEAVATSATVATLTGTTPGLAFTLAESEGDLAIATTQAAAVADPIPFGRILISQGNQAREPEKLVALAKSSLFSAQVAKLAPTYIAGAKIRVRVYEVRDEELQLRADRTETSATDLATTLTALQTQLNAALPASFVDVTVTDANTTLTFTSEVPGLEFKVEAGAGDEGASVPAHVVTETVGPNPSTSVHRALGGLSCYSPIDPAPIGTNEGQCAGNAGVFVANRGKLWVENAEAVTPNAPVFVEMGVAANNGKLFLTGSATRLQLARSKARWERAGINSADSVAVVRLAI